MSIRVRDVASVTSQQSNSQYDVLFYYDVLFNARSGCARLPTIDKGAALSLIHI